MYSEPIETCKLYFSPVTKYSQLHQRERREGHFLQNYAQVLHQKKSVQTFLSTKIMQSTDPIHERSKRKSFKARTIAQIMKAVLLSNTEFCHQFKV